MGLYSKLRKMGHGRIESLRKTWSNKVSKSLPFPSYPLIEIQIEEKIVELESLVKPRYRLGSTRLPNQKHVDILVSSLDSQLDWDNGERFSSAQKERYDKVLEKLAEMYPQE